MAEDIDFAAIRTAFRCIPVIKCKAPLQQNGADCGVFVTKYAENVLRKWPPSDEKAIQTKFEKYFRGDDFSQKEITTRRNGCKALLEK